MRTALGEKVASQQLPSALTSCTVTSCCWAKYWVALAGAGRGRAAPSGLDEQLVVAGAAAFQAKLLHAALGAGAVVEAEALGVTPPNGAQHGGRRRCRRRRARC